LKNQTSQTTSAPMSNTRSPTMKIQPVNVTPLRTLPLFRHT